MGTSSQIRPKLGRSATSMRVAGVAGGTLSSGGTPELEFLGVRRRRSAEAVGPDDAWHIGSCGKSITAALYGRLVERGLAAWGASLTDLLPDLGGEIDPGWNERTIEDLFHCRAGLQGNLDLARMRAAMADSTPLHEQRLETAVWALSRPPHRPGRFVYSNLGYIVVGAIIDHLAGIPYEHALRTHLLQPLAIQSLGYGPPPGIWGHGPRLQLGGLCVGRGAPADPADAAADNPAVLSSAGTMHLTLDDWARFLGLFVDRGGDVLEPGTVDRLLTAPHGGGAPMAMGWMRADRVDGASFGMQGSNMRWSATALLDDRRKRVAMVVCNDGRSRVLRRTAVVASDLLGS